MCKKLGLLHEGIIAHLIPSNLASISSHEDAFIDVFEVGSNCLALGIVCILSNKVLADLAKIFGVISKQL
jgi:hypothetical protein